MAWEKAEILHRDISCGNILIDDLPDDQQLDASGKPWPPGPRGFLNDWDMCAFKSELAATAGDRVVKLLSFRAYSRTSFRHHDQGTMIFVSGLRVRYPGKPHNLSDDLESFVHLINYLTALYYKRWPYPLALYNHLALHYQLYFAQDDDCHVDDDQRLWKLKKGIPVVDKEGLPFALSRLLDDLGIMCKEHLSSIDYETDVYPYTSQVRKTYEPPPTPSEEPDEPDPLWDFVVEKLSRNSKNPVKMEDLYPPETTVVKGKP